MRRCNSFVSSGSLLSSKCRKVVIEQFFHEQHKPFSTTSPSPGVAGVVRNYSSFTAAAQEAGMSRIYGGIHFADGNEMGLESGRRVGSWVTRSLFQPLQKEDRAFSKAGL